MMDNDVGGTGFAAKAAMACTLQEHLCSIFLWYGDTILFHNYLTHLPK
jgi:hypothetical protein